MSETKASKGMNEKQVTDLVKGVLTEAIDNMETAATVLDLLEKEFRRRNQATTFEKFLERCELPDLENITVHEVLYQLHAAFGADNITLEVNPKLEALDITLKTETESLAGQIRVHPSEPEADLKLNFVSFPVALPGDPELTWAFAKLENMTNEEAGQVLELLEAEFWASKRGQKLIRDRVDRSFPEFVKNVPASALREVGLKRHYKEPEAIRITGKEVAV